MDSDEVIEMNDTFVPKKEDMHKLVRAFVQVHVDGEKDFIGPNAPDAPFFKKVAAMDEIDITDYVEMADRFYKYINSQLPTIQHIAGYPPDTDWEKALRALKRAGEKRKEMRANARRFLADKAKGEASMIVAEQDKMQWIKHLTSLGYEPKEAMDLVTKHIESNKVYYQTQLSQMTVEIEEYEETWYTKNDVQRRWPRTTKRLELKWKGRNRELYQELKDTIPFPSFKWDGSRMSVKLDKSVILEAARILTKHGYIATKVILFASYMKEDAKPQSSAKYSATLKGDGVSIKIPYDDSDSRLIIKSINGRKWEAPTKTWLVPLSECNFLVKKLGENHKVSKSLAAIPEVKSYLKLKAERISISGASSLSNEKKVAEMKERLSNHFPAGRELYPFQYAGVRFAELSDGRCLIGDDMGIGKAQPLTANLLTSNGWKLMGEVQVGDQVIAKSGKATNVMGVYPQGIRSIYRVTFSDGTSTECCNEHLWTVTTPVRKRRDNDWLTYTTQELIDKGIKDAAGNRKWFIPVMECADFPTSEQPLDPYTLGALLGDGGLKYRVMLSSSDQEVLDNLVLPNGYEVVHRGGYDYGLTHGTSGKENKIATQLSELGIMGLGSFTKFVPDLYKFASKEQRLAVLQGLMDTDGTVGKQNGHISFSSGSEQLSEDVAWLVRSLGGVARIKPRATSSGNIDYRVSISIPSELVIFRLSRKIDNLVERTKYEPTKSIESIEYVREDEAQCIMVEDEEHLYVTDDFIVTHNTIQAIAYAALHEEYHPVLVVCPANVKYNWFNEIKAWLPKNTVSVIKNGKDTVQNTDFVVINYDLVKKQKEDLLNRNFGLVVCDESHYLKNTKAQRTKATIEVADAADSVLCLSGTAITNRPVEMFTTLEMIRPAEYKGKFFDYAKRYCGAYHNGWGWDFTGATNTDELHEKLRDCMIRRLKKEVLAELPDKIRQFIPVIPTDKELKEYKDAARAWAREYSQHKSIGSLPTGFVLNMLTDLRHRCGVLKVNATVDWVANYIEQNDKPLIIFAHHKDVLDALESSIQEDKRFRGQNWGRIDGGVSAEARANITTQFQNGKLSGLLCSTIAAKEGLTLTAADTVVFIEREWVPGWEEQAEDRVNRIGQDSDTVWATYLSVAGTIDERFDRIVQEKRQVVSAILDGGDIGQRTGIAKALLQSMVDAGEMPADMLNDMGFSKTKPKKHDGVEND